MDWVETKESRDEAGGIVECGFHLKSSAAQFDEDCDAGNDDDGKK